MAVRKSEARTVDDLMREMESEREAGVIVDPGQVGEDEPSDDIALAASLALLGETQGDAKVIVYQIDEKTKKDIFLYDCTVTEFSNGGLKEIQERYGKGEYRIRVYSSGRGVLTHRRVSIGESRIPVAPTIPAQSITPNIELLLNSQTQMMAGVMKEIAAMMRPVDTNKNMLDMIVALRPLLMPQQAPIANSDPLEMLSKLLDIQQKIAPKVNADGEVGAGQIMLSAMETFGKPLAEMMAVTKAQQNPAIPLLPATQTTAVPIAPTSALPIQQNPVLESTEMNETQIRLALIKPTLLLMAANDADPYPYACMALDMFTDEEIDKYIDAPDWWEQLKVLLPGAESHEPWFAKLRETIKSLLVEENSDSVTETNAQK